jgi:hypothetical protein
MSDTITGTIDTGVTLAPDGAYGDPVTIAADASISGTSVAVSATSSWTVENLGTVAGQHAYVSYGSYSPGYGMSFSAGGSVTNDQGGVISGFADGIRIDGGAGTIANSGSIQSHYGYGIFLADGGSVSNSAHGSIYARQNNGIAFGGPTGTVDNAGTITGGSGYSRAIYGGNLIINETSATIDGCVMNNGPGEFTLENSGTITSGVVLENDKYSPQSIINYSQGTISGDIGIYADGNISIDNLGAIAGAHSGIDISNGGTIDNAGTISGQYDAGIFLYDGGTVTNACGGTIIGGVGGGHGYELGTVSSPYGPYTIYTPEAISIVNYGKIDGGSASSAVYAYDNAHVTNLSGGTIAAGYNAAVSIEKTGTIENHGLITGAYGAIIIGYGSIANAADGTIISDGGAGLSNGRSGTGVSVDNAGLISATGSYDSGVGLRNGTVFNSGTIDGGYDGIQLNEGGLVSNASSGTITGVAISEIYRDSDPKYSIGTVINAGTITSGHINGDSGLAPSDGVRMIYDTGIVINLDGALITGDVDGVYVRGAHETVSNAGTIAGGLDGVQLESGGFVSNAASGTITGVAFYGHYQGNYYISGTVVNAGTITTGHLNGPDGLTSGDGVRMMFGTGIVTNLAGASITGDVDGVYANGLEETVSNAGTITGGAQAVVLDGANSNRLIVSAGAVFEGNVVADASGTAANVIELTSGASAGAISGLGTQYAGFQTVAIDNGAIWDIAGSVAGFGGVTIEGFNSHDRLDLTGLVFEDGDTAMLNGSDQLIIDNADGTALATIQLDGSVSGDLFKLVGDGHGGTFAEEDDYTPCYLRRTLIRTTDGEVPVERLKIGHWVVTANGEALPVKWIGRRSYRDWLAIGNADVQPVCFRAGSIADGIPARDLYVSPEHAMFLEGMLVPARHLVNGTSIVTAEGMDAIDYFHLEFGRHAVIFAEGAQAESFVDDDSRMLFHNAEEYRRLYPSEPRWQRAEFCAPRLEDGPKLHEIHQALARRAAHLRPGGVAAPWGLRGKVEVATSRLVSGWAFAGADAGPVALAVLINGAIIGQTTADRYRADLAAAGIGNGHHGFRFVLPKRLPADAAHRIEIRRDVDWSLL